MEKLQAVLGEMLGSSLLPRTGGSEGYDWLANERRRAEAYNDTDGMYTDYDCPVCKNKGGSLVVAENMGMVFRPCKCMSIRDAKRNMEASGIPASTLDKYTFSAWQANEAWQRNALELGREYAEKAKEDKGFDRWFVLAGVPGCGKTHLCTAVFRAVVEGGMKGRYLSWRDFSRRAKAFGNDYEGFQRLIQPLKDSPLLYIDDFWKGGVTQADVRLAFELLNDRYTSGRLTMISSEFTVEAIIRRDEAIGSRIYERSKGYYLDFSRAKNWRLKEGC